MTVTINTLGTNSRQIVISGETSATNIIDAVNTSLTALGWTLIDTVTSGSRGLQTTKVYSAPNADTYTTKYMIVRYDLQRQYWFTSCAEGWNTTTNVATNESWYGNRQILLPLQYSNCILYVFATARYACFMGTVQGEPSAWQGVFEFEREASEDIASYNVPCFGWTSSLTIGEPYGNVAVPVNNGVPQTATGVSTSNGYVAVGFAPPRTKNSLTGAAAAGTFTILSTIGSYPPPKGQVGLDFVNGGVTQTINSHTAMIGAFGEGQSYVWDSNKTLISNIKLAGYSTNYTLGKIFGLKITVKLGVPLDTTTVPVDANLFYSAGGSNTTHYLLGIHGGYNDKIAVGTNRLQSTVSTSGTAFGTPFQSVLVSGRYIYFTTTTGFHKFDVQTQGFTLNVLPAAAYYSVKFDGGNALYVSGATANTVYKVNLSDDSNTSLSMTGSWGPLSIDDDNLYVGSTAAGSTTTVKRVALSTFTEAASYTVTTGNAANFITHITNADYDGYVYVGCLGRRLATECRMVRIDRSSGTQIALTPTVDWNAGSATATYGQILNYDGTFITLIGGISTGGTSSSNPYRYLRIRQSDFSIVAESNNSAASTGSYPLLLNVSTLTLLGSAEPPSFAGMQLLPYSTGSATPTGGIILKLVVNDPRAGLLTTFPINYHVFDASNQAYGQPCTDQCSFFTMVDTTKIVRYTNAFRNYNFNGAQSSNILIAQ